MPQTTSNPKRINKWGDGRKNQSSGWWWEAVRKGDVSVVRMMTADNDDKIDWYLRDNDKGRASSGGRLSQPLLRWLESSRLLRFSITLQNMLPQPHHLSILHLPSHMPHHHPNLSSYLPCYPHRCFFPSCLGRKSAKYDAVGETLMVVW